ncbi:MAG: lipid-A-disaccharide synthase N-terminal domain-containing protein [Hyphomicrobiales bacterium]|nr:lipid-A-disaccharide synthase N-terminal domain-containing protein [Hyphomicrobiales bacterium]
MLIQLGTEIGNFFRETFVDKFDFWLIFGLAAQLVFAMRFVVQWISSERAGRSVVPFAFWVISTVGGLMTLLYGIVKREPVIIFGQCVATLIYLRNIMLIYREWGRTRSPDAG